MITGRIRTLLAFASVFFIAVSIMALLSACTKSVRDSSPSTTQRGSF